MKYEGNIIRPPSEASSILFQVTVGCSHNRCTFCGAYKGTRFRIKSDPEIDEDIAFAAHHCRKIRRVFLADGDALIMPQKRLVPLLEKIRKNLPWVNRVSLYGNAKSIGMKSPDELAELRQLGLDRVYMGLESGHGPTLARIAKGETAEKMIEAAQKIRAAGLFLSVTVLLGIAGKENSLAHARATGAVLTAMSPRQIAALTLMLIPGTPLFEEHAAGSFVLPDQKTLLAELRELVSAISLDRVQFQANHASNYLPINARLGRDKDDIVKTIDRALAGEIATMPEFMRAL